MHTFENFKGFAKAEVNLFQPLTVLIGPNGIGKTNLIEGIELLSYIASGQPLHTITDAGRGGGLEIRGGLQSCARRPATAFSLGFKASVPFEGAAKNIHYAITIKTSPTPEIQTETLTVADKTWFSAQQSGRPGLLEVTYDNFDRGPNKPTTTVASSSCVLAQYAAVASKNKKLAACAASVDIIRQHLRRSYVFDPSARLMRDYCRIGDHVLHRDGSNLSAVLYGLSTATTPLLGNVVLSTGKRSLQTIVDRIRQLPEEPFAEIGFEVTKLNDVLFGFRTAPDGPLFDARLLSDGTLRTLAVLTAVETCESLSRLVIEEFDNGIHPSRIAVLANALAESATRRKLNVLVTTHNPATLDALSAEQLRGVVVCYWKKEQGSAAVSSLLELPRIDELLERGRLGDLVTRRLLETYLTPLGEAERVAKAKAWLESLP